MPTIVHIAMKIFNYVFKIFVITIIKAITLS